MTAYERLMAEALPTGTFGHALRERPARWTPSEQAAHVAALEAELDRLEAHRPQLRVIDGHAT